MWVGRRTVPGVWRVVATGLLVVIWGCSDDDTGFTPSAPTTSASASTTQEGHFEEPPDGGDVRILEQGFTEFAGLDGRPVVYVGIVVENTSRFTAEGVRVTLQLVDASGAPIGSSATTDQSISLLRPGRFGIGATAVPRESGVSDVQVRLAAPSRWWLDDGVRPLADLAADDVTAQYHDRPSYGDVPAISVAFTVTSGYREVGDPVAYAVFRNAAGDIVGGSNHTESRLSVVGPGASEGQIHVREPIPDIDGRQTAVFVDVGL